MNNDLKITVFVILIILSITVGIVLAGHYTYEKKIEGIVTDVKYNDFNVKFVIKIDNDTYKEFSCKTYEQGVNPIYFLGRHVTFTRTISLLGIEKKLSIIINTPINENPSLLEVKT